MIYVSKYLIMSEAWQEKVLRKQRSVGDHLLLCVSNIFLT